MPYKPIAISYQSICKNPLKRTIFPQVFLHLCLRENRIGRCLGTGQTSFSKLVTAPQQIQNPQGYLGEQFFEQNCRQVVLSSREVPWRILSRCGLYFTFTVLMWKLVVVEFASKIFLCNIARWDGCGPQHCSWRTTDLQCFKFLIRQLITLNKTKIICSVTAKNCSLPVRWWSRLWLVTAQPFQTYFRCSRFYKHSCNRYPTLLITPG